MATQSVSKITIASENDRLRSDKSLIPGVPLVAEATSTDKRFMHYRNYQVILKHGPFKWNHVIGHEEFVILQDLISDIKVDKTDLSDDLKLTESDIDATNYKENLTKFLNAIFTDPDLKNHPTVLDILDISPLSFVEDYGMKFKEGVVEENVELADQQTSWFGYFFAYIGGFFFNTGSWERRWLVLKENSISVINEDCKAVTEVLMFDKSFQVLTGMRATGERHGIRIISDIQDRELHYRCHSSDDLRIWSDAIEKVMDGPGNIWIQNKRFNSFAPERHHCIASWFVDGESYMNAVADALESARDEIFITDWALSPKLFLKRPITGDLTWRLDYILKRKAESGVRVYVLIYNVPERAIDLDSDYAMHVLTALHPNISVLRHPYIRDHIAEGVIFWSHHEKMVVVDQTLALFGGIDLYFGRWDTNDHRLTDIGLPGVSPPDGLPITYEDQPDSPEAYQYHIGKDYGNTFIRGAPDPDKPFEEVINRNDHPRMPWHDISLCVYGQPARDLARYFIQQHNYYAPTIVNEQQPCSMKLLPRREFTSDEVPETTYLSKPDPATTNASCQILRSLGDWSGGLSQAEHSILDAYIYAMDKAEHFIYIENQFFISSLVDQGVKNTVTDHVRAKIADAHRDKKTFRVIICIPLLPEFEGILGEDSGNNLEVILYWELASLFRKGSLIDKLINEDKVPEDEVWNYVSVNGYRNHGKLHDKLVTELIYIHSKLLIVDDKITIIGSANLNDRSLVGDRDSEVCIILEDKEMVDANFDGKAVKVGKFSHSLRKFIFRECLGLLKTADGDKIVEDPIIESFYKDIWVQTAKKNAELFEQVFGSKCIPTNSAKTFKELNEFRKREGLAITDIEEATKAVASIKGHVVEFPSQFLKDEELKQTVFPLQPAFFQ